MKTLVLVFGLAGCAGKVPETRYYQLAPPPRAAMTGDQILVVEPLETAAAYDDDRIVYRISPYRMDYYQYHRWTGAPGAMVGGYLEQALERSGRFRRVVRELDPAAPVVLGGRVVAIEEVDDARNHWTGHIVLELAVSDSRTGKMLWTEQFDETEPLATQTPEGLARALSVAMGRIAARAAPAIADLANRQAVAGTKLN